MKFSLSSRQSDEYLAKADEIKVQYRDRNIIPEFIEKYPNAIINLRRFWQDQEEPIDWTQINMYHVLAQGRFILGLSSIDEIKTAKEKGYAYYYTAPAYTFQQLNDYKNLGVCFVQLGAPLFFQMEKVKRIGVPVRHVANMAYSTSEFEHDDGVIGTWIRPEDVATYEPYIDTIEFFGNKTQEQTLYRLYAEQHTWSGELGLVVPDLNYICTNRMVPPTLAEARLNCGQRCMETGMCHLCYRTMDLANPTLLRPVLEAQNLT